jgi:hypothetical protein
MLFYNRQSGQSGLASPLPIATSKGRARLRPSRELNTNVRAGLAPAHLMQNPSAKLEDYIGGLYCWELYCEGQPRGLPVLVASGQFFANYHPSFMKFIRCPFRGIVYDVIGNIVICLLITNNVFVVIAMP